jgi:acid phosphatase (class A)
MPIALAALLGTAPGWGLLPSSGPTVPYPAAPAPALADHPDWAALVGPPPAEGSPQDAQDLATLLRLQANRTADDVDRIRGGEGLGLAAFAAALGDGLDPGRCPLTDHLLAKAGKDIKAVVEDLKTCFARPRPCLAHPEVVPVTPCHDGFSYPSFHAARGVLFAGLLADLAPHRAPDLQARGLQIGSDRALGGFHHPSDVKAGQTLGAAFLAYWLRHPKHIRLLEEARRNEWNGQ